MENENQLIKLYTMYLAKQNVPGLEAQKSEARYNERQQSGTLSKQSLQMKALSQMILHKGFSCQERGVGWAEDKKKQLFLAVSCEMSELLSVASYQKPEFSHYWNRLYEA